MFTGATEFSCWLLEPIEPVDGIPLPTTRDVLAGKPESDDRYPGSERTLSLAGRNLSIRTRC